MDDVKRRKILAIIGKFLIIAVFVVVAVVSARAHEPWSDEAQSFLMARDNSVKEIVAWSKYEGTTPTWFMVIKLFLSLGGSYETYFLVPLLFTVIGLVIFEFKIKAPWYIRLLLPFTYFILFQYTVIARSYCMVFPALMWIASVYNEREKKKISYCLAMLFLMSICSFSMVIAGSLFLIDMIRMFREKKYDKKNIAVLLIIMLGLLATFFVMLPNPDCSFHPGSSRGLFNVIYQATIGSRKFTVGGGIIVTLIVFISIAVALSKEKDTKWKTLNLLILFVPVLMEVLMMAPQIWHAGNITILLFAAFMMNGMINNNKIIKVLMVVICLVQIVWSGITIKYEIENNYSGSKDAAMFIKENSDKNRNIYGLGFDVTALQPYFSHNIFKNQNTDKSFWIWKNDNGYIQDETLLEDQDGIFVIGDLYLDGFRGIYDKLKERGYQEYYFEGNMFAKTYILETKGYYVLAK